MGGLPAHVPYDNASPADYEQRQPARRHTSIALGHPDDRLIRPTQLNVGTYGPHLPKNPKPL